MDFGNAAGLLERATAHLRFVVMVSKLEELSIVVFPIRVLALGKET